MRIFDPKDQLGNSLLNSADTQKSSIKLEKKMEQTMGVGGEVVLTTADVEDIRSLVIIVSESHLCLLKDKHNYLF